MTDEQPRPDLQQSPPAEPGAGQAASTQDEQALAESLLSEYYVSVYRLAYALLEDEGAARRAARSTFALALARGRGRNLDECAWLYSLALKAIARVASQLPPERSAPPVPESLQPLFEAIAVFGGRERRLLALLYAVDCPLPQAAKALGVSQGAAQLQLGIFRQRFAAALGRAGQIGMEALDARVREIVQARWPVTPLLPAELAEAAQQARQQAALGRAAQRKRRGLYAGLSLAAAALLALVCLAGGAIALSARLCASSATPGPLVTPFTPAPTVQTLGRDASDAEIRQRLKESAGLWRTLWVDAQMTEYGPPSYIGPPRVYRARAWVRQEDESVETFGLLDAEPNSLYLATEIEALYINPLLELATASRRAGDPASLLHNAGLRQMVFPAASPWMAQGGWFQAVDSDSLLERRALLVDWLNPLGKRQARLWIDTLTGLVLRQQVYGGEDFQTLLSDALVTQFDLDQGAPPASLADTLRTMQAGFGEPTPAVRVLQPTPTLALQPTPRLLLPPTPAPPALDPAHSLLKFQFPRSSASTQYSVAEVEIELFADDYSLGFTRFGLPWALRCIRSSDGLRLAFNSGSDGAMQADESLRWLDLRDPAAVYQPLPSLRARYFAFSPDSRQLAVIAVGQTTSSPAGIYLVEVATGEYELWLELQAARSLAWSPDGQYLAFVAQEFDQQKPALLVLHVKTRQVIERIEMEAFEDRAPDWTLVNWGVELPQEMGGMESCAAP
ncbi:MAG: PD40 domain-containing protein [Anaerolineales bacterium]|nr:PD40 domain-containing protein [Anaerolineales bacterium]